MVYPEFVLPEVWLHVPQSRGKWAAAPATVNHSREEGAGMRILIKNQQIQTWHLSAVVAALLYWLHRDPSMFQGYVHYMLNFFCQGCHPHFQIKNTLTFGNIVDWRENKCISPQYLKWYQCIPIYDCSFNLAQHYLMLSKGPDSLSAALFCLICNQGFILLTAEFFSKMPLESGCN